MRTIKFRIWNTKGGNWYTDDHVKSNLFNYLERTEEPVMQFTGLLDRNGKEIYEGDILTHNHADGRPIFEVHWLREHARFGMRRIDQDYQDCLTDWAEQAYTVLGNIYENPELLT